MISFPLKLIGVRYERFKGVFWFRYICLDRLLRADDNYAEDRIRTKEVINRSV